MFSNFDTIIVGGGAMGSACAYYLARKGNVTLVIERFQTGHSLGSSHGESRIIRYSYEHPRYVQLAKHNYKLWADLEAETGETLLHKTGDLSLGDPDNPLILDTITSLKSEQVQHETLDSQEILKRYPQFNIGPKTVGIWQPDGGILSPEKCVPELSRLAVKEGAEIIEESPVTSISTNADVVTVCTETQTFSGKKVILTAGAWSSEILDGLGANLDLSVTQEQYAYFKPDNPAQYGCDRFPLFLNFGSTGSTLHYGFPVFKRPGVKMALHHAGVKTTANTRTNEVDLQKLEQLQKRAQALLPGASAQIIASETCLYTTTPDTHFVIDRLRGDNRIIIGAGFSGHGFKFMPLVGKILAELATNGRTRYPIDMFAMDRFES